MRARLLLAALLILGSLPAGRLAAADVKWAFGDSITHAVGWDTTLPCTPMTYPTSCGYPGRLATSLAQTVYNRGVSGEYTMAGKSRVDDPGEPLNADRCTDPNAGDVILVMHGTNDVSDGGVSTTTTKMNIDSIVTMATGKCVHTLLAPTIRRLLAGSGVGTIVGDPNHAKTADLKNKVYEIGTARGRQVAPVWANICPNEPCFDVRYTPKVVPGDPGHPNSSGFNLMEDVFFAVLDPVPTAGATAGLAPVGVTSDTTPTFTWDEHADADWYFLQVTGPQTHGRWYPEEAIGCAGGTCSVTPFGAPVSAGEYQWRVRTRNLRGVGAWTAQMDLDVVDSPPAAPTLLYPLDDIFDTTPTYRWRAVSGASQYDLLVENVETESDLAADSVCSAGVCQFTQNPALALGNTFWRVRAENPVGSTLSNPSPTYEVLDCSMFPDLDLEDEVVTGTVTETACGQIIAGDLGAGDYVIDGAAADVVFHAGSVIELRNGFEVVEGSFTARVDY